MKARERFLRACRQQPTDTTPIWIMRQAGRYLPEYRALKERHSFTELVQTPRLATEVTLQPLKRFDLDAAILFSDILVIPEALGQPYRFRPEGGIEMAFTLNHQGDLGKLSPGSIAKHLSYIPEALYRIKEKIGDEKALLGFGGSPWTLATYMVEGGSIKDGRKILAQVQTPLLKNLLKRLSEAVIEYFHMQIEAGADAIQIFDSWGHLCPQEYYWEYSLKWIADIITALPASTPIILYAKGVHERFESILKTKASAFSLDWNADLKKVFEAFPGNYTLQGNLHPALMNGPKEVMLEAAKTILENARTLPGHIFNLGHGIEPQAKPENVEALVEYVHTFKTSSGYLPVAAAR